MVIATGARIHLLKDSPMKSLRSALAMIATLAAFVTAPASAGVVAYSNLAAFNAATVGNVSHNFEGIAPAGGFAFGNVTVDGVDFSAAGNAFVIDAGAGYASYGASFFAGQVPGDVLAVSAGTTAIGFFYGSYAGASQAGTATLNSGDVFALMTPAAEGVDLNFIGFVSDGDIISSIHFTSSAPTLDITQFITARSASVPEPGSVALVGLSLLGLSAARRRARR